MSKTKLKMHRNVFGKKRGLLSRFVRKLFGLYHASGNRQSAKWNEKESS